MKSSAHTRSTKRRRWLIAIGVLVVAIPLLAFASYKFATTTDALHLTVTDPNHPSAAVLDTAIKGPAAETIYSYLLAEPDYSEFISCPIIKGRPYHYRLVFSHLGITTVDASFNTEGGEFIYPVFGRLKFADDQFWSPLTQVVGQPLPNGEAP